MLTNFSQSRLNKTWRRNAIKLFIVIFLLLLVRAGRSSNKWPFVQWPLYADAERHDVTKTERYELRVIDTQGVAHPVLFHDLYSLDDDSSRQHLGVREMPDLLFGDDNSEETRIYQMYMADWLQRRLGLNAREVQLWEFVWSVDYSAYPPIQLDSPDEAVMLGRFLAQPYRDQQNPPPPPDQDADLVFADELELLAFDLPFGSEVASCDAVYARTWWRTRATPAESYHITVVLTDSSGVGQASSDDLLGNVQTQTLATGEQFGDWRVIELPCALPAGQYDLLAALYQLGGETGDPANLPVAYPDGAPVGEYAYLTSLTVSEGGQYALLD